MEKKPWHLDDERAEEFMRLLKEPSVLKEEFRTILIEDELVKEDEETK